MRSLILYSGNDPFYLGLVWHLAAVSRKEGQEPVMMDMTDISAGVGDDFNRKVLRGFRSTSPEQKLSKILRDAGLETVEAHQYVTRGGDALSSMSAGSEREIAEAVRSALISYARDPFPDLASGTWRKLKRSLTASARLAYLAVSAILSERPEISEVLVANGRFPQQRAAIEAANAFERRVLFYEKGDAPDTYWLEDHSALDRILTQRNVGRALEHLSDEEALALGQDWMNARSAPGSELNIYTRFFEEEGANSPSRIPVAKRKVVGLFTSSQDEFAALGPEWHLDEWADQWDGFGHVLNHLEQFDFDFYLRVHPNFATKSHASFVRERANVQKLQREHPALRIIWHDEQANSYVLLGQTDVVVVWDSTIGLEASGRGIPVWELAASYYDLYADVRQWFSPAADPGVEVLRYTVDTSRTHRFMAYLALRHSPLPAEAISVQSSLRPSPGLVSRVAAIASTGGAPTVRVALASIADALRHRRFSINMTAARRFFSRRQRA